jgi:hypothetical protein
MEKTTLIFLSICVLLLLSSSGLAYYYMSEEPKPTPPVTPPAKLTATPPVTPPVTPPATPPVTPPVTPLATPIVAGIKPVLVATLPEPANAGEAISCTGYNPKGAGAIYRYDGDKKMRHYPNPDIAGSWDSDWPSGVNRQLDCTGFVLGDDIQFNPGSCNKNSCNNVMNDWIINKYWAFSDTAKNFGECKNCNSRWFTAPFRTSTDGTNWKENSDRNQAYEAVKL